MAGFGENIENRRDQECDKREQRKDEDLSPVAGGDCRPPDTRAWNRQKKAQGYQRSCSFEKGRREVVVVAAEVEDDRRVGQAVLNISCEEKREESQQRQEDDSSLPNIFLIGIVKKEQREEYEADC